MKKNYKLIHIFIFIFCTTQLLAQNEIPDNKGKEFWVMFNRNFDNSGVNLSLFITGDVETSGTVELPDGSTQNFTVIPGTISTVKLPSSLLAATSDGVEDKGIRIVAFEEITVYGLNQKTQTTDAFLALPTDILEREYLVMSYTSLNENFNNTSVFGIVATENGTTITLVPSTPAGTKPAGVPFTIDLDEGQSYQLQVLGPNDLTGTSISSTKPVAVFAGHTCAYVPTDTPACDHMIEQMPPASSFGERFVTTPLANRKAGDIFRILASEDGTNISLIGSASFSRSFTLNRGQFEELDIPSDEYSQIVASGPVLVAQYSKGQDSDGVVSDPFMMLIPPYEQFQNNYTVTTPAEGFNEHFINLAVPDSQVGKVLIDGSPVPASVYTAIGETGFSGAQVSVAAGTHNLGGALPFGAFMYGFGNYDSYGYPGGQALGGIANVSSISLTLDPAIPQGENYCLNAAVLDDSGNPVVGVRVDFSIAGASSETGFALTDTAGQAEFCYTPEKTGEDTITATIGNTNDQATVAIESPLPSSLTLEPEKATVVVGEEVCITGLVFDQFGDPLEGIEVFTEVDGEIEGSGISDENGEVEYCFTPTESGTVSSVFYYGGGDRVTAELTVTSDGNTDTDPVPASLTLEPETVTVTAGQEVCITGTVSDQFGNPLEGVEVFTEVDGELVGSGISEENGEVLYCFTPTESGTITIVCYYRDGERVTAEVTVTAATVSPASLSLEPEAVSVFLGEEVGIAGTVLDQFGNPLEGTTIFTEVDGQPVSSGISDENGRVVYRFTPKRTGDINIVCYYQGGERVTAVVTVVGEMSATFTLVDAESDTDILEIRDGGSYDVKDLSEILNIRADFANSAIGSVVFDLEGPLRNRQTQCFVPYAVFGDVKGDYNGRIIPPGDYVLTTTPYSEAMGGGVAGGPIRIRFSILFEAPEDLSITGFELYDAFYDTSIMQLEDGSVIDLGELRHNELTVLANTLPDFIGSVKLELLGPVCALTIENYTPFTLFGNNSNDFYGKCLAPGSYTLKATPYTEMGARGAAGIPLETSFEIRGVCPQDELAIYPVPFSDHFAVENRLAKEISVKLYNQLGQSIAIRASHKENGIQVVPPAGLQPGVYILQSSVNGQPVRSTKIVKSN